MGLIISSKEQIDEYFASEAMGQSTLKKLLICKDAFLAKQNNSDKYYQEKDYLIIGSGVDCKLTGEDGQFDKEYYVSESDKPGEAIMSVIQQVFDDVIDWYNHERQGIAVSTNYSFKDFLVDQGSKLEDYKLYILDACRSQEYCVKMKDETVIDRILSGNSKDATVGSDYFKDLCNSYGKQIISVEENAKIIEVIQSLRGNSVTAKYFDREVQAKLENVNFYYQLPIYFEYEGIKCKALLDLVIEVKDEEGNTLYVEPIDLKTTSNTTLNFLSALKSFRYDIQAAWYTLALESMFKSIDIKSFKFIVESTSFTGTPLIYDLHETLLFMGRYGREKFINSESGVNLLISKEIMGFQDLMKDYLWYEENGWEQEKVVKKNEGVLKIDWNGII
jgi:hypothetical protein